MTTGGIEHLLPAAFGAAGVLYGLACYAPLRRWVRHARGARVVVAYKRRTALEAPRSDWIEWAHMLNKDEATRGRVVFRGGHVAVAIAKPDARQGATQVKVEKQT